DAITEAFAQPVSPTLNEETLINELVEQPAARVDPSAPSPQGISASSSPSARVPERRAWPAVAAVAVLAAGTGAWYFGTRPAPTPLQPAPPAVVATPAPAAPGADQEGLFW